MSALIRAEAAALGYGGAPVLQGVTCEIARGDFVGLVGPNGAGKTTFLRGVLGLLSPSAGTLAVDRSLRFAYVPQAEELNLHWPLSTRQTVELALRARRPFGRLSASETEAAAEALARTGLSPIADKPLAEASGGQRQKAILAQALAQRPDALLLDEPTRGLDVAAEADFLDLLRSLNRGEGLTLLFVTHSLPIPMTYADHVLLFHEGRVRASTPEELVRSNILEAVYGRPFVLHEESGLRWAAARPSGPGPRSP